LFTLGDEMRQALAESIHYGVVGSSVVTTT